MDFKVDYKLKGGKSRTFATLLATSESELQELVDHVDRVSRKTQPSHERL